MKLEIEIPEPALVDRRQGWGYDFDFLKQIKDNYNKKNYYIEVKQIEEILDVLFEMSAQQRKEGYDGKMKTIKIHKATGYCKPETEGIIIEIDTPINERIPMDRSAIDRDMEKMFKADAEQIFNALAETLPDGTKNQLEILFSRQEK